MIFTRTDRGVAESLFAHVARETSDPNGGVCRPSYGRGETIAWQLVADAAQDLGICAKTDVADNLLLTCDSGPVPPYATWIGSHLDSVPSGGNYDGLAGVVAALLLVAKVREKHCSLPLVGLGLRGEESAWFGTPYLGSKALFGKLYPLDLDRQRRPAGNEEGLLLRDYMELLSILWPRLVNASPLVTTSQVAEFWELHIEQGPFLAARNKPVGVVTGIRGNVRAPRARVTGRADHSGTTPHDLRHDAVVRFAKIMTKLEAQRSARAALGDDLVFTCGVVGTNPKKHSITTIADEVNFALEVRSMDDTSARDFLAHAESLGIDLGEVGTTPAVHLSPSTWKRAHRACVGLEIPHEVMPSGAGHDAAVFQGAGIPSGMIFVRNTNGSHNPAEAMDMDDFLLGCEVMWRTIVGDMS